MGGADSGTLLAPETVRRLACDASIIPVVLGARGEVLDFGLEKRLFTPAQTKRLWLRDGDAPSRAARPLHTGLRPIILSTGQTSARPTWRTPHWSAVITTPPFTSVVSPARSSMTRREGAWTGT